MVVPAGTVTSIPFILPVTILTSARVAIGRIAAFHACRNECVQCVGRNAKSALQPGVMVPQAITCDDVLARLIEQVWRTI
jgi:hypothetical protein